MAQRPIAPAIIRDMHAAGELRDRNEPKAPTFHLFNIVNWWGYKPMNTRIKWIKWILSLLSIVHFFLLWNFPNLTLYKESFFISIQAVISGHALLSAVYNIFMVPYYMKWFPAKLRIRRDVEQGIVLLFVMGYLIFISLYTCCALDGDTKEFMAIVPLKILICAICIYESYLIEKVKDIEEIFPDGVGRDHYGEYIPEDIPYIAVEGEIYKLRPDASAKVVAQLFRDLRYEPVALRPNGLPALIRLLPGYRVFPDPEQPGEVYAKRVKPWPPIAPTLEDIRNAPQRELVVPKPHGCPPSLAPLYENLPWNRNAERVEMEVHPSPAQYRQQNAPEVADAHEENANIAHENLPALVRVEVVGADGVHQEINQGEQPADMVDVPEQVLSEEVLSEEMEIVAEVALSEEMEIAAEVALSEEMEIVAGPSGAQARKRTADDAAVINPPLPPKMSKKQ